MALDTRNDRALLNAVGHYDREIPGHPADLDGDDQVGTADLIILLANWGPCP